MHLSIILMAIALALLTRLVWSRKHELRSRKNWTDRWQSALSAFLLPPLILIVTSLTVLQMGHHGTMLGLPVGWIGCLVALGFLTYAMGWLIYLGWQGWRSLHEVRTYPLKVVVSKTITVGRILYSSTLFAGQIGFWQPELVLSQSLLTTLDPLHLEAVLAHEQAHYQYRDTFWFFGLGWLRQVTAWLPRSQSLWQELVLLRELRADHWASQQVDALVLAEALLLVARSPFIHSEPYCPILGDTTVLDQVTSSHLEERIEALIHASQWSDRQSCLAWSWVLLAFLPWLTILLHA
jgi:Zn-dependent protease with chaperone function